MPPANYVADFGGGAMFLVTGLLAALLHARATGAGQVVDAAMTEGAAYLGSMTRTFLAMGGWKDERAANMLDGGAPNYRCYECARRQVGRGRRARTAVLGRAGRDTAAATIAPSPYDPAQWDACADGAHRRVQDAHARRVGRDLRAAGRVRRARPDPRGSTDHPHNVARSSYTTGRRRDARRRGAEVLRDPGTAGPLTPIGGQSATILAELGYSEAELAELRRVGHDRLVTLRAVDGRRARVPRSRR